MKPSLIILAAGMASRYGSMKQMEGFGPSGETIMEYSIYDAIRAGFGKIVFIIRKKFENSFRELIEAKIGNSISVEYVFQEIEMQTDGFEIPKDRTKPWGTAHAVLCAADKINEPFAVINADDFYGSDSFKKASNFLMNQCNEKIYGLVGYELLKTLSANGTVNRGICTVDEKSQLASISERINISLVDGKIKSDDGQLPNEFLFSTQVSMNFWCFSPSIFTITKKLFQKFLTENIENPKAEFYIPAVADFFIKENGGVIKIIQTSAQWFGVTYKEDAPFVKEKLMKLIEKDEYPVNLW